MFEGAINHGSLGPGDTGIGNENVEPAVELLHDGIYGLLNGLGIGDLNLVGLRCGERRFRELQSKNSWRKK